MRRIRMTSVALAALALPLAGMALVTACGGNDNQTGDAGPDVTTQDVAKDVAPDNAQEASSDAGCATDVDLTQYLPSADASMDVDAGFANLTQCTGCLKSNCGTEINTCNADCSCRQSVVDAVTCVASGGDFQTCGEQAILGGDQNVTSLFTCALGKCKAICLGDGGISTDSGSDGSVDATGN